MKRHINLAHCAVGTIALSVAVAEAIKRQEPLSKAVPPPTLTAEHQEEIAESVARSYETRQQRRRREQIEAKRAR